MKTLYIIRHAKSSWDDLSLRDIERPLNKRGKKDAPFMAAMLSAKEVSPDKIITSPAVRANSTALHFARAFDIAKEEIKIEPEIYEAYPSTIIRLIQAFENDWNTVFVFGHNPTFTDVINWFTPHPMVNLPTCGIGKITAQIDDWKDFSPDTGKLEVSYFPKDFK